MIVFIPSSNTKGYYHFDNSLTDHSGNSRTGTGTSITYTAWKKGYGATFNGTSSKITFSSPFFTGDQDPLTYVFWANITSIPLVATNPMIYAEMKSADGHTRNCVFFSISSSQIVKLGFDQYTPIGGGVTSSVDAWTYNQDEGLWFCYAMTKSSDTVKFYKNGSQLGTDLSHTETYQGNTPDYSAIGARIISGTWSRFFNGMFGEFIAENVAWTDTQVARYYSQSIKKIAGQYTWKYKRKNGKTLNAVKNINGKT